MSPTQLEVLLHYYYTRDPYPDSSIAVSSAHAYLKREGLIATTEEQTFITTARGNAHVRQILELPLPESAWVGSNGKVIES